MICHDEHFFLLEELKKKSLLHFLILSIQNLKIQF